MPVGSLVILCAKSATLSLKMLFIYLFIIIYYYYFATHNELQAE